MRSSPVGGATAAHAGLRVRSLLAQVERDVRVARRNWRFTLLRTAVQPTLSVFVFAFVLPHAGETVGGASGGLRFATALVPGMVGLTAVMNSVQAVAIPLITDFNATREIEDRVASPVPLWAIAGQKVVTGAVEGIVGGLIVLPIALFLPSVRPVWEPHWFAWPFVLLLVSVTGGLLGLTLGSVVRPAQVQLLFIVLLTPMTFLGATFYPWTALGSVPWLQFLLLLNPVVYANEALRATMTPQVPHMPPVFSVGGLCLWSIALGWLGVSAFVRRCGR